MNEKSREHSAEVNGGEDGLMGDGWPEVTEGGKEDEEEERGG